MPCPTIPALLKAMLIAERLESERLRQIIREFQRHRFGRRAESLPEDQLQLALEDAEQAAAAGQAASEQNNPGRTQSARRPAPDQPRQAAGASAAHRDGGRRAEHRLPVLCGHAASHRRGRVGAPGRRAGPVPGAGRASAEVRLPRLQRTWSCRRRRRPD